jgi:predicted RNA-binding Zn-ribbon protein involved in translation (DUF1610 family)
MHYLVYAFMVYGVCTSSHVKITVAIVYRGPDCGEEALHRSESCPSLQLLSVLLNYDRGLTANHLRQGK